MKIVSNKPTITRKELEAVLDCLINDDLAAGESVKHLETGIAKLVGLKYALATNSLTSAYHLIFKALDIDGTSEVIMPSFFPQAPFSALSITGGKPVLVDCQKDSLFPSAAEIKSSISERTKAVVTGHLFGYHFNFENFDDIRIPVIEDISHSIGTEQDDIPCGNRGTFTVASFDPSGIITTGNGGIILTNNSKYYSLMKELRGGDDHSLNFDYSITDFQAAMGISQLPKLPDLLARRREIAKIYHESLRLTPHKTPYHYNEKFAYHSFPVHFDVTNEKTENYWRKNKIEVAHILRYPLHYHTGSGSSGFPNSERLSKKLYAVPLYPTLSRKDIEKIAQLLAGLI
jgi:perosamine synthetase